MSKFIETIRIEKSHPQLLKLHILRMRRSLAEYGLELSDCDCNHLHHRISAMISKEAEKCAIEDDAIYKCRILYGTTDFEKMDIHIEKYTPRPLRSLRLLEVSGIDYHLKYEDRSLLNRLHQLRDSADDVIIVSNGLLTDTTYANLICHTIDGRLLTPSAPLLGGVMRCHLLQNGEIEEYPLTPADLLPGNHLGIQSVSIINAMLPLGRISPVTICAIVPPASTTP